MFCLNYYPSEKYLQDADQFKIRYRPADKTLEDFLQTYSDKSIVIDVSDAFEEIDVKLFKALYEKYKNFKLIVDYFNKAHLDRVIESKIPFFFSNFVVSFDQIQGYMKYHPTDMYICSELGFFLDKISKLLHENNIKVRVIPNICQSSFIETPSQKTFFVRPDDIPIYSTFVDVFEIFSNDKNTQKVLYSIYKQEKWFGKLNAIIPSFKGDLDSKYILPSFGMIRSRCGKRCSYAPSSCNICDRFLDVADSLKKNNIVIRNKGKQN